MRKILHSKILFVGGKTISSFGSKQLLNLNFLFNDQDIYENMRKAAKYLRKKTPSVKTTRAIFRTSGAKAAEKHNHPILLKNLQIQI